MLAAACLLVACTTTPAGTTPSTTRSPTTAEQTSVSTVAPTAEPTTTVSYPTTTEHTLPADCDATPLLAEVDARMASARLAPGSGWRTDGSLSTPFDAITQDAEEFRYRMGLDCRLRASQRGADGSVRLLVAAWTGQRSAFVVQASDAPSTPYRADQRLQLMVEIAWGEWLVDQFVWAGTLADGRSMVIGTADAPLAVAAKAWPAAVPRFEDLPVTIAAQRYGIDALLQAGARNVSVAEPAEVGAEIAAVQFITPAGLHLIATVAPPEWFDPAARIVDGEMAIATFAGIDVYVTTASAGSYAVASVGRDCGYFVWFIDSLYGTVDELVDWAATLIASTGCGG